MSSPLISPSDIVIDDIEVKKKRKQPETKSLKEPSKKKQKDIKDADLQKPKPKPQTKPKPKLASQKVHEHTEYLNYENQRDGTKDDNAYQPRKFTENDINTMNEEDILNEQAFLQDEGVHEDLSDEIPSDVANDLYESLDSEYEPVDTATDSSEDQANANPVQVLTDNYPFASEAEKTAFYKTKEKADRELANLV
jgi:hypothetical protein